VSVVVLRRTGRFSVSDLALVVRGFPQPGSRRALMARVGNECSVVIDGQQKEISMYSSVIVGVDGENGGRDAAALAASLTADDADLAVVHVCVLDPVQTRAALELLERERELCGRDSDAIRLAASSVGSGLDRAAEERHADLIVVGSCHRHLLGRVVAGDDTASVLHRAHCAVAIAPIGYASEPGTIEMIGLAYDGSPEGEVALAHAGLLAASVGAKVIARHVVVPRVYASGWGLAGGYIESPEDQVAAARERLGDLGDIRLDVVFGAVDRDLVEFSTEVDLLVCGSRHNGAVRRVVLGSTSDYLAHHARCPVLVTPTTDAAKLAQWSSGQDVSVA
jgi:nucleotide-binding universal stress UspA family protein